MSHAGDYLRYFCSHGEICDIQDSNILERGLSGFIKYWVILNSFLCRNSIRNEPQSDYVMMGRELLFPLTNPLTSCTIWEPSCYMQCYLYPLRALGCLCFSISRSRNGSLHGFSSVFRDSGAGVIDCLDWANFSSGSAVVQTVLELLDVVLQKGSPKQFSEILWFFQVGTVSSHVCLHVMVDFGSCQVRAKAANARNK